MYAMMGVVLAFVCIHWKHLLILKQTAVENKNGIMVIIVALLLFYQHQQLFSILFYCLQTLVPIAALDEFLIYATYEGYI